MHHKKVSIIIPVYQVENYLERAVDSALAQTLEEKEIILVDDGSLDASAQICDHYAQTYPELIQVIHKENEGLGMARNTGIRLATGEYIAFLDSDDAVEPEMYEEMYAKAIEDQCDIVMCDVKIIYVEEGRTSVVSSYPSKEVDLSDYIANGNNITYSVNKLFRRSIWEENQYEKMLFEDISLIPSLMTKYSAIGYVPKPFYRYYRRSDTLSTSMVGEMVDIVQALRNFIDHSDVAYRDEVIYCAAKQIYWNMTKSRELFQADFINLLKEYQKDFLLNPYIPQDKSVKKILDFLAKEVIPATIICVHIHRPVSQAYMDTIQKNFPKAELIDANETYFAFDQLPENIQNAQLNGNWSYVEEYYALKILCEQGGIVLNPDMQANLNLQKLRLSHIFFGFEDTEALSTGCYGALKEHYVVQALLDTYGIDSIYNKAFLPLSERLRDFLILHFHLKTNGRKQLLKNEVQIHLPSVLAYDMKDGENCAKKREIEVPDGYELVSDKVLKMWSDRIMENWNLYKQEREHSARAKGKVAPAKPAPPPSNQIIEKRIEEVKKKYETSTCWRLTKPLRMLANLWRRRKRRS
jgi:glycosyltransferase involved in cell wall biosynthesis